MRVVESEWEGARASIASLRDITERKRAEEAARRLIREQTARTAAEQAARRFRFLAESSTVLSSSLDYRTTLSALVRLCVVEVADWAVIYVIEEGGGVRRLEVAHRDPALTEAVRDLHQLPIDPAGPNPVLDVVRTRTPLLVRTVDEARLLSSSSRSRSTATCASRSTCLRTPSRCAPIPTSCARCCSTSPRTP